jgi:AraC family ethanolamine operon transcriptional activator
MELSTPHVTTQHSAPASPGRHALGVHSLSQSITGWQQVYDQLSPGHFQGALNELFMGPAQIFLEFSSHALVQTCNTWSDSLWFGIPVQRGQVSQVEGVPIGEDTIAVRSGKTEFQLTTPDNFGFFGVVVKEDLLKRYLEQEHGSDCLVKLLSYPVLKIDVAAIDSLRWWLAHTLYNFPNIPEPESSQAMDFILEETLSRIGLLLGQQARQPKETVSSSHARRVIQRVQAYVMDNKDRCIKVHDLCEQLGISRRALQDCFHKTMGCTPKAYLSAFGLNAARRELEEKTPEQTTVSDVATRHGFWHLSQFATDYRKFFGELPSQTLRKKSQQSEVSRHI